jgi:5-methylcytosine-specific restriction endonuclease McrA
MEQSIVYVKSATGHPLMPTRRQNKVWYWLRKGLAHVVCREPLTIQLQFETTRYTQPVTVGVDTGSQVVGIAAVANEEVVLQAEVHLRTGITQKLDQRRQYRRNRRSRKTRYRPARFANRRRNAGWLPPSLQSKAEATVKAVRWVATLLPVGQVNVEIGSFDTQQIQNPEITGEEYQHGELHGYLVREYLLAKWQRTCVYCSSQGIPLQIEHIVPKVRGGTDRVSNLALACKPCNRKKGSQTAGEFGYPQVQAQAKISLKDAAHVSSMKTAIVALLREQSSSAHVSVTYGYETKYTRIQILRLPKSHINDAVAIACRIGEVVKPSPLVFHLRCVPRGNYQMYNGKRSEHKVWAPKKVHGWKLCEVVEAKGQIGYIAGRRIKGAFVIKDVVMNTMLLEVTPRKLRRLARSRQGVIIAQQFLKRKEGGTSSPV